MSSTKHVSDHSNVHSRYFTSLQSLGHIFPVPMAVKTDLLGWFLIQSDLGGLSQTNKVEAKVFCLGLGIFTPESRYFLTQRAQERRAARWCYGRYTDAVSLSYHWVRINHSLSHPNIFKSILKEKFSPLKNMHILYWTDTCVIIFENILLSLFRNRIKKHSGDKAFWAYLVSPSSFLRLHSDYSQQACL